MKTTILLDHAPVADGDVVVRVLLSCLGEAPRREDRTPLNLSLVLDRSGSMHGGKIRAVLDAAGTLVRRLDPRDRVSVVVFDHRVDVLARPGTGGDQADLAQVLRSVQAGGSTNLSGGWLKGRELVASGLVDGGVNRVLLLTDGLANQGIVAPEALVGLARSAAADRITTTTLGFGEGFDEELLQAMADAGGGNAYYIERPDQAGDVFGAELEGLLGVVAQNLSVTLRPGPDSDFVRVLHDYPFEERGTELRLDVGDVYAREPRRLLAEFLVPAAAVEEGGEAELARFEVRADVVLEGGSVERQEIDLPVRLSLEKGGRVEPEVRREMLFLAAAEARAKALEAQERGDVYGATEVLREAAREIEASGVEDEDLMEQAADLEMVAEQVAHYGVAEADRKYMYRRMKDLRASKKGASRGMRRKKG